MENLTKMDTKISTVGKRPIFGSVIFSCSSTSNSVGIFPPLFLLHFLALFMVLLCFPAASQCESVSQPYMPSVDDAKEMINWSKDHPTIITTPRHRQIRHLHFDDEHNIQKPRKRQNRRHALYDNVEDREKDDENLKRLMLLPPSNNSADDEYGSFQQHPKQAPLLQKQQSSSSQDLSTVDISQSVPLTGETEDEGGDFPNGYWVRIAQAKVLALAVENGTLPRPDENSEIMKPASCRKDHMECTEFTTKCAEDKAVRILSQLALQHKQPTRENVTLYMSIILKECGINMYKQTDYFDDSDQERVSDSKWNLNFPPAKVTRPLPVFHCNQHKGQDNVLTNFRMTYMSNDGKVIGSLPETLSSDLIPRYFVIEMNHGGGRWSLSTVWVQPYWLFRFSTKTDYTYQIRVTAVSPKYIYPPVISPLVTIYKSSELTIVNPRNLHVVNITMDNGAARPKPSALLRWESGSGHNASCDYNVYYMDDDEMSIMERKKGDDAFWAKLENLHYQKNYSIRVIEKFGGGKEANVSTHLVIPSCLEMWHFSFDHCPPPPPFQVRVTNITDDSFWITWNPPMYANHTNNRIVHYNVTVDWFDTPVVTASPIPAGADGFLPGGSQHHVSSLSIVSASQSQLHHRASPVPHTSNKHRIFSEFIPGNVTSVHIKNTTHLKGQLKISVAAVGLAGASPLTWQFFTYKEPLFSSSGWTLRNILTFVLAICGVIGLVILICFLKHVHDKRQRQKKRQQKFENYEKESLELQQHYSERDATKWEIDCCNLDLREGIGKGNFGLVRRAILNHKGKKMTVAVKTLRDGVDSKEVDKLWEEYDILRNLDPHVHIVGLKGIVTKHVPLPLLVVEYCDGGDLQSHLRKAVQSTGFSGSRRYSPVAVSASVSSSTLSAGSSYSSIVNPPTASIATTTTTSTTTPSVRVVTNAAYFMRADMESPPLPPPLTISDLLSYSRQVAVGMEYLSSNKIVHRDLAARNILISGKSRILKISDFGLSRDVYEQNWYKRNSKGDVPIKWLPLECILNEIYTTKSDVWSYGILLWEIFTYGGNPYPGVENMKVFGLLKDGYRMPRPDTCPIDLYQLMRLCWGDEPNERPDFTGIRLILEDIIERVTHVTYLNLESCTKVRSSTAEGRGGICAAVGTYKNCDSGFDEYDESPTTNEPVLPPRNKKTFG